MESTNEVIIQFDQIAKKYDEQRKKLIPCFHDFYQISVALANTTREAPAILDIGAGTGLFSSLVLEKYPNAHLTLIDISEKMLDVAKVRFQDRANVTYIVDDYTKHEFNEKFDIIISALSIHHLTELEKKNLYSTVFSLLNDNGVFINADQVLGHTDYIETLYKDDWKQKVESSGLSQEEISAAYERTKLDKMSTLDDQLTWLKEIGFSDVDCVYKYYNFVVFTGRKQG
ncbi:class I SAM-dependent methyltransferase [Brevibacillus dissolubilis]|uniref:class I SAM-dependent methyltransferase n=1 Tax=Brevibacillus dissolubilis TaxID=1844116 RepID=UPI00111767E6|nr:class I SAM-dependent methyltransferase [Brevibacillus dissolubilis]